MNGVVMTEPDFPPHPGSARPGMAPGRAGVIAAGLVFFDSALGQFATLPNLAPWYESLQKPWFNPPNVVFGPVWTLLYCLMALAFWRILILPRQPGRGLAIGVFLGQLLFTVLWSFAFFGAQSPLLGLAVVIPQWLLVVATLVLFARLDRLAGLCFVPLSLWVGFAGALNFVLWRMN
jgi:tryptophan-rich sensory protein